MERTENLNFNQTDRVAAIGKALSSEIRIQILEALEEQEHNVNELAELLELPASSTAMHVRVLEEAGLIETELRAAVRGSLKMCRKSVDSLMIQLRKEKDEKVEKISMPIGNYVDYHVEPTCGIVSGDGHIDMEDEPAVFYNPRRVEAKLLWFGNGYLEYRFSNASLKKNTLRKLEISAEVCAEDHEYNMDYPSDITVWVNEIEAGTYECPSDFGGRKGRLTPNWWPEQNTQYGELKTWCLKKDGTYLDGKKVTEHGLAEFKLEEQEYISVRIGVKEDAVHKGGMNLFGNGFGDYPQDIVMKMWFS